MNQQNDRLWSRIAPDLTEALGLSPMSREEAEYEASLDEGLPLDEKEIEEIVRFATMGGCVPMSASSPHAPSDSLPESSVEESILQLNRNAGEVSDEVRERIDQIRQEVLSNEDDDEDNP